MSELSVSVSVHHDEAGPCTVIHLVGEADVSTQAISEAFAEEVASKPRLLVADLSGLSFIDSWALSVIMRTHRSLQRDGGALALVSPSPTVARVLQLIDIASMMRVYPTLAEAIAGER